MAGKHALSSRQICALVAGRDLAELASRLSPDGDAIPEPFPATATLNRQRAMRIWDRLTADDSVRTTLLGDNSLESYQGNIENCIGEARLPLGIVGPLRVNGLFAKGDYAIPLATTEAALVASYHRGCALLTQAGGCTAMLLYETVHRSPVFAFSTLAEAGRFLIWVVERVDDFRRIAAGTTRHGELLDMGITIEANHVYLNFEFATGDASGQNMVTLATQAICDAILADCPTRPRRAWVEGNLSGDKKASAKAFTTTRGKKVTAESTLSPDLVRKYLHTTPRDMEEYWRVSAIGGVLSGTMGVQGHFANGLAALYIATGQDAACVAESATGITRFETLETGELYAAVTLPGLMVGTVGGGTGLPTPRACLQLMGLAGDGHARALAEVTAGLMLAGELSIIGALASGQFSRAHRKLARERKGRATAADSGL